MAVASLIGMIYYSIEKGKAQGLFLDV